MEKSSPTSINSNPSPDAKRRYRVIFVILGLVIVGLIGVMIYQYYMQPKQEEAILDGKMSLVTTEVYKLSRASSDSLDNIFAKDDRLLYFNEGDLILQDLDGRTLWKKSFSEDILLDKHQIGRASCRERV